MYMYEVQDGPLKGALAIDLDMKRQIPSNLVDYVDETDGQVKKFETVADIIAKATNVPEIVYYLEDPTEGTEADVETDDVVHMLVKKSGKLEEVTL